jgi:hypothetical protein
VRARDRDNGETRGAPPIPPSSTVSTSAPATRVAVTRAVEARAYFATFVSLRGHEVGGGLDGRGVGEIVIDNGPHPAAESDFELFCEFMPEALGI